MKDLSDSELLEMLHSESANKAFEEIYRRYSHLVYGVCLKYFNSRDTSLDAVIEIFEMLLLKLPNQVISNFASWLYSVTKNHCLMELRKQKRELLAFNTMESPDAYNPEPDENDVQQYTALESAINFLSGEQKNCIMLFYFSRKSYTEIAEETGYSVKMVKSHLQNGRIKLKKLINK